MPRSKALPGSPAWRSWGSLKAAQILAQVSKSPLHWQRALMLTSASILQLAGWSVQRHLHSTQNSSIIHLATLLEGSPPACTHIPPETEDDGPLHAAGGRQPSKPHSFSPQEKLRASIRCGLPVYAPELAAEPWQTLKLIM